MAGPEVRLRVVAGVDPETACEAWAVEASQDGPEYVITTVWGYAGPAGCLGIFARYVAAAYHVEGYSAGVIA